MRRLNQAVKSTTTSILVVAIVLAATISAVAAGVDVIINGSFVSDTTSWTFVKVAGNPTGSWDSAGYLNGGCAKTSSEVGRNKAGQAYWQQTISTIIQANSTVTLSYAWKKGYAGVAPAQADLYVTAVKPSGATVDLDSKLGAPQAWNTWYTVSDKDVSSHFDETGTYTIRLRFVYKTGNNKSAQAIAWFDEVKLLVAPPMGNVWVEKADTPDVGGYGESLCGDGNYIYIARCLYATSTPQFWRYDPSSDSWNALSVSGLPTGAFRNGTAIAWDYGDRIYALCGARYEDADRRLFFSYSISANSWTQLADTPAPQGAGDAIAWSGYDNRIYALLGSSSHGTAFARYDPLSNTWELRTSPPGGIDDGCSLVWTGGRYLYALRGEYLETSPLQDFWRYDIISDSWVEMAPIPEGGGVGDGGSLLWIGNWLPQHTDYIYALGGGDCWENPGDNFYRYVISTNTWERLAKIPYPITYYNGSRLGFAAGHIYYWQGTTSAYYGGGKKFCMYEFPA
ncbi:MAG: hypothetical protein QXP65_01590 [Candidatus Hadarchaeales archaeon]